MHILRSASLLFCLCSVIGTANAASGQAERPAPSTTTPQAAPYLERPPAADSSRVPYTGAPGRTRAVPGTTNREDQDPIFKRDETPHLSIPQGDGKPAAQGPGDAIGKTVPERPTQIR